MPETEKLGPLCSDRMKGTRTGVLFATSSG